MQTIGRGVLCFALINLVVSGCSSIRPPLTDESVLPLSALTAAINCELTNTIVDQIKDRPWLLDWQGQYAITLKANHVGYLRATTNTFPVVLPRSSLLNLGVGGGVTGTANRTAIFKYNIKFKDLPRDHRCEPMLRSDGHPFLAGEIGFRDWMARAIQTSDASDTGVKHEQLSSIGHTFEFILDLNAAISPSFVLMPAPSITLNPTASFERVEDNIVDVSFGKLPVEAATVADLAKILSKPQEKEKAKAEATARTSLKTIAAADRVLSIPANQALLQLDAKLPALKKQLQEFHAPSAKEAVNAELKQAQEQREKNAAKIEALKGQKRARDQAKGELTAARDTVNQIKANPEATTVVRVPAPPLSPELNPNVTGTLLQLQLERLVGSSPLRQ